MISHPLSTEASLICFQRAAHHLDATRFTPDLILGFVVLSFTLWLWRIGRRRFGAGDERQLAMQPSKLSEFMTVVRDRFEQAAREGEAPVLVTSAAIRPFVRSLVERFRSQTTVLSQAEIHPRARLKTVGSV